MFVSWTRNKNLISVVPVAVNQNQYTDRNAAWRLYTEKQQADVEKKLFKNFNYIQLSLKHISITSDLFNLQDLFVEFTGHFICLTVVISDSPLRVREPSVYWELGFPSHKTPRQSKEELQWMEVEAVLPSIHPSPHTERWSAVPPCRLQIST